MPQLTNWRLANFSRARSLWQHSRKPHSMGVEEYRSRWGARPSKPLRRDYVSGGFDSYLFRNTDLQHHPSGSLESAKAEGGTVMVAPAGTGGVNWIILYQDGTLEVYGLHLG